MDSVCHLDGARCAFALLDMICKLTYKELDRGVLQNKYDIHMILQACQSTLATAIGTAASA